MRLNAQHIVVIEPAAPDSGGGLLTNNTTGIFSGYGTINANGGFSNYGTMTLQGGTCTVNGAFDNQGGGWLAPVGEELLALNRDLQPGQAIPTHQTPLPASSWLFLSGLVGLGLLGRKKLRGRKKN